MDVIALCLLNKQIPIVTSRHHYSWN